MARARRNRQWLSGCWLALICVLGYAQPGARVEEAIDKCEIAIGLDPDFGNPYNDIGVYLIDLGRPEEAVPWLQKAIAAKRYCCYQFAHANLGRVQLGQGKVEEAKRSFEQALEHDPEYLPALMGLEYIKQGGFRGL